MNFIFLCCYKKMTTFTFKPTHAPPLNTVGLFTFLRTYSRRLDENKIDSKIESWTQALSRVVNSCNTQLNMNLTEEEANEIFNDMYNLRCLTSGRMLWQAGTSTVDKLGLMSTQNCAFTIIDDSIKPFLWTFNFLMLGSGVGFRILPSDLEKTSIVMQSHATRQDTRDADFIVSDSRNGWVKLLEQVLLAHFVTGKSFTYSCILVRGKGELIKGFGGLSSGAEILSEGLKKIDTVLNNRAGLKMRPVDALDVMNILGSIVVAGNIRRSALLALGDVNDNDYMRAKRWDLQDIPNWRAFSNNSVICNDIADILANKEFWEGFEGNGECIGLINLNLHKKCGRIGEVEYGDPDVQGVNPCSEMSLENKETCNLSEIILPHISSKDELYRCVRNMYRICKHAMHLRCVESKETEDVVHKNYRMGIGITGYMQATEEQKSWLSDCAKYIRDFDTEYSKKHNFPVSRKLKTCKPSGSLSLVAGVTSGVHPAYSQYYIRRIRIASDSPLLKVIKECGYHVEPVKQFDGTLDHGTLVVEFPYSFPDGTITADKCSAVQQLEVVKRLQTDWSDNAVSVTVTYKKEELPDIKEWLKNNYNDYIKSVSFLLHSGHNFQQAPIEPITKEEYNKMVAKTKPLLFNEEITYEKEEELLDSDCAGGSCPIK